MSDLKLGMREKDVARLASKIEEAVNTLSLEHYLDMPDFIIGTYLAETFNNMVKARQTTAKWSGKDLKSKEEQMKTCKICKKEKSLDEFSPIFSKPGKHHPWCTQCRTIKNAEDRKKKREAMAYKPRVNP